jgi:hypothetical protein
MITENTPPIISENAIETIPTEWCDESLVTAFINMIKIGLVNKRNKYFVLISGACIPLYNFNDTYNIIMHNKSRIEFKIIETEDGFEYFYSSQWVLLSRKDATLLTKIDYKSMREFYAKTDNCPDEIYPMAWFTKKLGYPGTGSKFDKEFDNKITTFTEWPKRGAGHPKTLNKSFDLKKLCDSEALFARKFTKGAAEKFGLACSKQKSR